jgi:HEAT repeat protein
MLEIWMGAALDSSPVLKGDALTNVGRFAAELPATSSGAFRRRRAAAVLLRVVEDTSIRVDMRGAAATALHYVLGRSSRELCPRLQGLLNVAPDQDPHWELRGTVITALGQMECRESRATLEQILLEWKDVPRHVATTVPSVLARLGAPEAIPALLAVIKRPDTPEAVFGTAISAVGRLGANSTATTQSRQRTDIAQALVAAGRRTKGDVLIAILGALRNLGDRGVLPFVVELSTRLLESDKDVRGMALTVVIQLGEPTVEAHLSHIAFDSEEQLLNRMLAVMGLGGIHTDTAVDQLEKLHRGAPAPLQRATIEALRSLYQSGSGRAGAAINRLEQEGATSDNDQEPAPLSSLESLATEPTPP